MQEIEHETAEPVADEIEAMADEVEAVEPSAEVQAAFEPAQQNDRNLDLVMQIPVSIYVMLGSASMPVSKLMKLGRGSVVALDRKVGEPIDLVVNGRVIARGEVVLLEDGSSRFGISLTEIVDTRQSQAPSGDDES